MTDSSSKSRSPLVNMLLDWPLALCLLAAIYLALLLALPQRAVWISDEGNRFIAIKALASGNGLAIANNAAKIAPGLSSFPPPYFVAMPDGSIHSGYHPSFPALCALPYRAFGLWGARAVPLLAGLLCALLAALLAKELGAGATARALSTLATGLCTPLAFYSQTGLEMTCASALCAFSALLLLRAVPQEGSAKLKTLMLAGLLLGLAALLREEGCIAAAASCTALLLCGFGWRRTLAFALPCGLVLLPLWAFNIHESGSILGLHAKIYASLNGGHSTLQKLLAAPVNAWFFLLKPNFNSIIASVLAALPFMLAALAGASRQTQFKIAALACCLLAALANFLAQALSQEPLFWMLQHQSLAASMPLAAIPLIFLRDAWTGPAGVRAKLLLLACGLYALGVGVLLDANSAGIFWGARHFMPIAPQLCALALCLLAACNGKTLKWLGAGLLTASLLLQLCGLQALWLKKSFSNALIETVAKPDAIIATDVFWAPEEFALAPESATIVFLRSTDDLKLLAQTCKSRKQSFTLLLSRKYRQLPNEATAWIIMNSRVLPGPAFSHPKLGFMELQAFTCAPKN